MIFTVSPGSRTGAVRSIRKRFDENLARLRPCHVPALEKAAALPCASRTAKNHAQYLASAGYPAYANTDVTFYGDTCEALEAQKIALRSAEKFIFMEYHAIEEAEAFGRMRDVLAERLHTVIRLMGPEEQLICRLGVSSGAGGDSWEEAHALGAEAFLSGEIKHHEALGCVAAGMVALEAGHYATEAPGIFALADALQTYLNALQCNVCVSKSLIPGYLG